MKIISTYQHKPILGICLGAQALTCYYGGEVIKGDKVMHGKVDTLKVISHHQHLLYQDIPEQFSIMRYHSLISNPDNFPEELKITDVPKIVYSHSSIKKDRIMVFSTILNHLLQTMVSK